MDWAAVGGFLVGLAALGGLALKLRSDQRGETRTRTEDQQERRRDLQAYVAAQTEALLEGYRGVFDEYKRQADALVRQLQELTEQRDELVGRVHTLEREVQRVPELERMIEALRARIVELEREKGRAS